jgi:hypothetical protein
MRIRTRFPSSRLPCRAARITVLALAVAVGACGGGSPEKAARDTVSSVRSWTATVRLAGEAWLAEKAPRPYAEDTFRKAGQTMEQELATLRKQGVPPVLRPGMRRLAAPAEAANRMADAAKRNDRASARRELAALAGMDAALAALDERLSAAER